MKASDIITTEDQAQVLLPSSDLPADIAFFSYLGFLLQNISPADDPAVAVLSGHGVSIRLDKNAHCSPATIHLLTDTPEKYGSGITALTAPNGTIVKILPKTISLKTPPTRHKFEVRQLQDGEPWVIGRAGMLYRDLIPDRLGGSIIASHIRIPDGGPVLDMVHYHTIGFQLIYCYKGWVKLVYEDQGPPFILRSGDCVTQPPEIRHRVLESSDNLEVIEIGVPAKHQTTIDHDLELPTLAFRPDRIFQGQVFCHHRLKEAKWLPWRIAGFEYRETGINLATHGAASVQVARRSGNIITSRRISHDGDILFTFVLQGKLDLKGEGHPLQNLNTGDAFVIPPFFKYTISDFSKDLELLEVSLPGNFKTVFHE